MLYILYSGLIRVCLRLRGLMDKASPSGGEDWRFESARGRRLFFLFGKGGEGREEERRDCTIGLA